jgi:hypothetical protein
MAKYFNKICLSQYHYKALIIASVSLILIGVNTTLIHYFGSVTPYWDQWDAEADILYRVYLDSSISLSTLVAPHSEHRIFFTRILSLLLFELNGSWDVILQMLINVLLHVIGIILYIVILGRVLSIEDFMPLSLFSAFVFIMPIGWENVLLSIQSCMYLLIIFSLLSIIGLASSKALTTCWWFGLIFSVASYFSTAGGTLTAATGFGIMLLQVMMGTRKGKGEIVGIIIMIIITLLMLKNTPTVDAHSLLKAQTFCEFLNGFYSCIYFPQKNFIFGVLINLPVVLYTIHVIKMRPIRSSPHWVVIGLIGWLFLQVLALCYGRAGCIKSSRYLDIIIMVLPINFLVMLYAYRKIPSKKLNLFFRTFCLCWLILIILGIINHLVWNSIPELIQKGVEGRHQTEHVKDYLKNNNIASITVSHPLDIPYPNKDRLAMLLSDNSVKVLLPDDLKPFGITSPFRDTAFHVRMHSVIAQIKALMLNGSIVLIGIGLSIYFLASFQLYKRRDAC